MNLQARSKDMLLPRPKTDFRRLFFKKKKFSPLLHSTTSSNLASLSLFFLWYLEFFDFTFRTCVSQLCVNVGRKQPWRGLHLILQIIMIKLDYRIKVSFTHEICCIIAISQHPYIEGVPNNKAPSVA